MVDEMLFTDSGGRVTYNTGGLRDNCAGKGRYDLISPIAIRKLAMRCEVGAMKYGEARNWEKGLPISEFVDSALRHIYQYMSGMDDEDHLGAALWNLMAIAETEELRPEMQDLPRRKSPTVGEK